MASAKDLSIAAAWRGGVAAPTSAQATSQRIPVAAETQNAGTIRALNRVLDWENGPDLGDLVQVKQKKASQDVSAGVETDTLSYSFATLSVGDRVRLTAHFSVLNASGVFEAFDNVVIICKADSAYCCSTISGGSWTLVSKDLWSCTNTGDYGSYVVSLTEGVLTFTVTPTEDISLVTKYKVEKI